MEDRIWLRLLRLIFRVGETIVDEQREYPNDGTPLLRLAALEQKLGIYHLLS